MSLLRQRPLLSIWSLNMNPVPGQDDDLFYIGRPYDMLLVMKKKDPETKVVQLDDELIKWYENTSPEYFRKYMHLKDSTGSIIIPIRETIMTIHSILVPQKNHPDHPGKKLRMRLCWPSPFDDKDEQVLKV